MYYAAYLDDTIGVIDLDGKYEKNLLSYPNVNGPRYFVLDLQNRYTIARVFINSQNQNFQTFVFLIWDLYRAHRPGRIE